MLSKILRADFTERGEALPAHVELQLAAIDALTEQIKAADLAAQAMARSNSMCELLMTAPGIGPRTSLRFVAALDHCDRFADAHQVASYLGLAPGEDSSSTRQRITSITKAGSSAVRWLLVEAAWSALRWRPNDPI